MDGLIGLFLENPFFLLIIIFVIARFFFSANKQASQSENETGEKKPTIRSLLEQAMNEENVEKSKQVVEEKQQSMASSVERSHPVTDVRNVAMDEVKSIEQAHEEQLERFKSKYQPSYDVDEDKITTRTKTAPTIARNLSTSDVPEKEIDLDFHLTQKKLMESIIMAEVLGPPRALNRYENIAMKRRR